MIRVIDAPAGCGKTTALTQAWLALVLEGHAADQIATVTFTRKAAAELQSRVSEALLDEASPHATRALAALPDAPIGTIDGLVQSLLQDGALDMALGLHDGSAVWLDLDPSEDAYRPARITRAIRSLPPEQRRDLHPLLCATRLPHCPPARPDQLSPSSGASQVLLGGVHISVSQLRVHEDPHAARRAASHAALGLAHDALRREAGTLGLLTAAERCEAVIRWAKQRPARLKARISAVLVDELQDADPLQHALFVALSEAVDGPLIAVGDVRQSIYGFRGADPGGHLALHARADERVALRTNFRATPELATAQADLCERLHHACARAGLPPTPTLDGVSGDPRPRTPGIAPDDPLGAQPIVIIAPESPRSLPLSADQRALRAFYARLCAARAHDPTLSAAVLAPSWATATRARDQLVQLAGSPSAARLDGTQDRLARPILQDLATWLDALASPDDAPAWLALYTHPAVGLSHAGALALTLGQPPAQLSPTDQQAYAQAAPALTHAQHALTQSPPATVLAELGEALALQEALRWTDAPDIDAEAYALGLSWVEQLDRVGHDARSIARTLRRPDRGDAPRSAQDEQGSAILCTTVFQAKGLAWDHLCLLSPGQGSRHAPPLPTDLVIDTEEGPRWVMPLAVPDALGLACHAVATQRAVAEHARLLYVGLTRARSSVVLGLPGLHCKHLGEVQRAMAVAWAPLATEPPDTTAPTEPAPSSRYAWPTPAAATPAQRFWQPPGLARDPSALAQHLDAAAVQSRCAEVAASAAFSPGQGNRAPTSPADQLAPAVLGSLAHAWLARWAFRQPLQPDDLHQFAHQQAPECADALGAWLHEISASLPACSPALWARLTDPQATLRFEHPLLAPHGTDHLTGRADLLLFSPDGVEVIDFKAGAHLPERAADLTDAARFGAYIVQLDAYCEALAATGLTVNRRTLWFMRSGASASW